MSKGIFPGQSSSRSRIWLQIFLTCHLTRISSFTATAGGRSAAAATLAVEEEASSKNIYNLEGGILAFKGRMVPDYPKVQVFDKSRNLSDLLLMAMDLEKGALKFYKYLKDRFAPEPFSKTFGRLSAAERAHAKAVYQYWKDTESDPSEFETVFENLKGEILEGGEELSNVLQRAEAIKGNACLHLVELALHVEHAAFDLYRTMAERTDSKEAKHVFLSIAQAEKRHMGSLIDTINQCDHPDRNSERTS